MVVIETTRVIKAAAADLETAALAQTSAARTASTTVMLSPSVDVSIEPLQSTHYLKETIPATF